MSEKGKLEVILDDMVNAPDQIPPLLKEMLRNQKIGHDLDTIMIKAKSERFCLEFLSEEDAEKLGINRTSQLSMAIAMAMKLIGENEGEIEGELRDLGTGHPW